jgi:hypothetical protein
MPTTMEDLYFSTGLRAAAIFALNQTNGRINATSTTVPYYGLLTRAKGLNINGQEPRKITAVSQDRATQIDWLPPLEAMDADVSLEWTELDVYALTSGVKVETLSGSNGAAKLLPVYSSQQGNEPQVACWYTRQAENISGIRRWESYVFPVAKMIGRPSSITADKSDMTYKIAPTITTRKIYGEALTDATNGATTAQMGIVATLEMPYLCAWLSAATPTVDYAFRADLPANSVGASVWGVWVDDVLVAPADYTAVATKITLDAALDAGKIITCLYGGPSINRTS